MSLSCLTTRPTLGFLLDIFTFECVEKQTNTPHPCDTDVKAEDWIRDFMMQFSVRLKS